MLTETGAKYQVIVPEGSGLNGGRVPSDGSREDPVRTGP
jgi:hypothetical protein